MHDLRMFTPGPTHLPLNIRSASVRRPVRRRATVLQKLVALHCGLLGLGLAARGQGCHRAGHGRTCADLRLYEVPGDEIFDPSADQCDLRPAASSSRIPALSPGQRSFPPRAGAPRWGVARLDGYGRMTRP